LQNRFTTAFISTVFQIGLITKKRFAKSFYDPAAFIMTDTDIEKAEIDLFIDAVYRRYGYDFRHYAKASLRRRVRSLLQKTGLHKVSEMIPKLLHDENFFENVVRELSVTVTEMFRDPDFFRAVREKVIPYLRTYPFVKIWHAGCATGEEAYSLAVVLTEEGLYERSTVFATDFNPAALAKAKEGIFSLSAMKDFTANYQQSGGTGSFSDYYHARYGSAIINNALKQKITFADHNLVTDGVFGEMNLILCRNVMIYFDKILQNRVIRLFYDSLIHKGFFCLGTKESLQFSDIGDRFALIDEKQKIWQKKI